MIRDLGHDYWTGTVYTTNRRVWEHDDRFRHQLRRTPSMAIDMETATIFAAAICQPHLDCDLPIRDRDGRRGSSG
jgi:nucleoside phosphorylase